MRLFSRPVPFLHELYRGGGDVAELAFTSTRRMVVTRDAADVKRIFTAPPDDVPSATARIPSGAVALAIRDSVQPRWYTRTTSRHVSG